MLAERLSINCILWASAAATMKCTLKLVRLRVLQKDEQKDNKNSYVIS